MSTEKLRKWSIITGTVLAISVIIMIALIISFIRHPIFNEPRVQLVNGEIIHVYETQTFQIFIEDYLPPTLEFYEFTFIDTENQNRITSLPPANTITYSIGSVVVQGEIISGRFGSIVALAELEPGSYIVEFPVWEGPGIFVWGDDGFWVIVLFAIQLLGISIVFIVSLPAFTIFLYRYLKKEKPKPKLKGD